MKMKKPQEMKVMGEVFIWEYEYFTCPYCLEVMCKNEGCTHIKCRRCGNEFCQLCSARRSAIMCHEMSYHRPKCPLFSKYEGENKYTANCLECKMYNSIKGCNPPVACPKPKDLTADRDIPEEELAQFGFELPADEEEVKN